LTNVLPVNYLTPDAALCGAGTRPPRGEDARWILGTIDDAHGSSPLPITIGRPARPQTSEDTANQPRRGHS